MGQTSEAILASFASALLNAQQKRVNDTHEWGKKERAHETHWWGQTKWDSDPYELGKTEWAHETHQWGQN